MSDLASFDALLAPLISFLAECDPKDRTLARTLAARFPVDGPELRAIAAAFTAGVDGGWLCGRDGGPGVKYSRVRKATTPDALSVEAVRMDREGPGHLHPNGEIDLCFATGGDPRFDGHAAGWVVYPPGTWHVPTVTGGSMDILYFLPGGAIEFGPKK